MLAAESHNPSPHILIESPTTFLAGQTFFIFYSLFVLKAFQRTKLLRFEIQLKNSIAYSRFSSPLHLRVKSKSRLSACILGLMFLVTWLRKGWKQIDREPADGRLTLTLMLTVSLFSH